MGPGGVVYDSDSSLTLAAAKSLSLSNSLSKQCGLELDQQQLLDDASQQQNKKKGRRNSSSNDSTSSVSEIFWYKNHVINDFIVLMVTWMSMLIHFHYNSFFRANNHDYCPNYHISCFKFVILSYLIFMVPKHACKNSLVM